MLSLFSHLMSKIGQEVGDGILLLKNCKSEVCFGYYGGFEEFLKNYETRTDMIHMITRTA